MIICQNCGVSEGRHTVHCHVGLHKQVKSLMAENKRLTELLREALSSNLGLAVTNKRLGEENKSLREVQEEIANEMQACLDIIDTSQTCSKGNEEICGRLFEAIAKAHGTKNL